MKKILSTKNAPEAIGPYSQGILANNFVFTSGQLPIKNGQLIEDIKEATKASLDNIKAILESENLTMENIVKTTVYLKNMDDFTDMNEVYGTYFKENPPARSAIEVKLPKNAIVEIECIAYKG